MTAEQAGLGPLEGERKFVTVMFADIAQSSRLIAGSDPEDADDHLLAVLQVMIDAVHRYGGTVNQVLGDGIMALFGAPRALEDHALRACLAADTIHRTTQELQGQAQVPADFAVEMRVGLSSGEVVIKSAEDELDRKYRATGEAVYLAQRMEDAARAGVTMVSQATLDLVAKQVRARPAGKVRLKSDSKPVDAIELVGIELDRRSFRRLSGGALTAFVGRTDDLAALYGFLDEVDAGRGRVVVLKGDAGIGKSRLLFEFLAEVRQKRYQVVTCDSQPAAPIWPLEASARVLRGLLPLQAAEADGVLNETVIGFLESLEINASQAQSAILETLGQPVDDPAWDGLDPPGRLQVVVETITEIVLAVSRRHPLVIVFEDFHWADSGTRALADEIVARVPSSRVMMIATCRTHYDRTWADWPQKFERHLQPLSRPQTAALLDNLLGLEPALRDLKTLLTRKTQGNPFFIEECVRALEAAGTLVGEPGAFRPAVPTADLKIPGSVHGVLAERIDTLPAPEKQILLCASVIGRSVDVGLLRSLCPMPREEMLGHLSRLQDAGFLERTRIMPNVEYSFRHALIHDVAYGTLLKRRRRELHEQAMTAIERRRPAQLSNRMELLAHHAFQAENWPKALAYCRRAGLRAQAKSAHQEAVNYFAHALQAVSHLPHSDRYKSREIDARLELVQSLSPLVRHDQVQRQLLAARQLASETRDERRLTDVMSSLVQYHWARGELEAAIGKGREALAMAKKLKDPDREIKVAIRLGGTCLDRGDYESARQLLEATISKIHKEALYNRFGLLGLASTGSRGYLASALGELGRFEEAIKVGDEGIRIAEESAHAFSQIHAAIYFGNALIRKGDFERSLPPLSRCYELCETTRSNLLFPLSAASLGYAHVWRGNLPRGLELLQSAIEFAERRGIWFEYAQELTRLGEACLLAGNHEKALDHARNAMEYAERHGAKGDEAWALWLLGQIYGQGDATWSDRAEICFHQAQETAFARHMKPLLAHIDFGLGMLYGRRRAWSEANLRMESAVSLYRSLGMSFWLQIAEEALTGTRREEPVSLAVP